MKKVLIALAFVSLMTACKTEEEEVIHEMPQALENPFIHHVYFYLNNPDSIEDRDKLEEGLNILATVSTIQEYHISFPASTDRDVIVNDYAISWLAFFKDMEEEEMYQVDPIHLKFIEDYSHLWSTVKVYDSIR